MSINLIYTDLHFFNIGKRYNTSETIRFCFWFFANSIIVIIVDIIKIDEYCIVLFFCELSVPTVVIPKSSKIVFISLMYSAYFSNIMGSLLSNNSEKKTPSL